MIIGGKNGAGVYQRIINLIPPHRVYVEPFAGSAAVLRHKRPAERSIAIDACPGAIDALEGVRSRVRGLELIVGDGVEYLRRMQTPRPDTFVYADPPYVRATRKDPERDYYAHDWTDDDHQRFLDVALALDCRVMISGYASALYAQRLRRWWSTRFATQTRGGPAEESLWMNYSTPSRLHDYRYLGDEFPERWRIHKRQRSWLRMLSRMPGLERRAMIATLTDAYRDEVLYYLGGDAGSRTDPGDAGARAASTNGGGDASRRAKR